MHSVTVLAWWCRWAYQVVVVMLVIKAHCTTADYFSFVTSFCNRTERSIISQAPTPFQHAAGFSEAPRPFKSGLFPKPRNTSRRDHEMSMLDLLGPRPTS